MSKTKDAELVAAMNVHSEIAMSVLPRLAYSIAWPGFKDLDKVADKLDEMSKVIREAVAAKESEAMQ